MTAADDLIRRLDAINCIRNAMKHIYTAARKVGYKESIDLLSRLPGAKALTYSIAEPVMISPGLGHSHWFISGGVPAVRQLRRGRRSAKGNAVLSALRVHHG